MTTRAAPPSSPRTVQALLAREHTRLRRQLRTLRSVAETMNSEQPLALRGRLDSVIDFLRDEVLPHMEAEERTVYAAMDRLPDGPHSGAAMAFDHHAIRVLVEQVKTLTSGLMTKPKAAKLQRVLFALEAIGTLHLDKEELLYTPELKRLSAPDRATILAQLQREPTPRRRRATTRA